MFRQQIIRSTSSAIQPQLYLPQFGDYLYVGSSFHFISHRNANGSYTSSIGRILTIHHPIAAAVVLEVVIYKDIIDTTINTHCNDFRSPPFDDITEVVETLETRLVSPDDISKLCFIIPHHHIQTGLIICHGITNFYSIRFRLSISFPGYVTIQSSDDYFVFPSQSPFFGFGQECYHSKIYDLIHRVQDAMIKLMNRSSEKQLTYFNNSARLNISKLQWNYIMDMFMPYIIPQYLHRKNYKRRLLVYNNLTRHSFAFDCNIVVLRFYTIEHVKAFACVFGKGTIIGTRAPKPTLRIPSVITDVDILNYIIGHNLPEGAFQLHTNNVGIDLIATIYPYNNVDLTIMARYAKSVWNPTFDYNVALEVGLDNVHLDHYSVIQERQSNLLINDATHVNITQENRHPYVYPGAFCQLDDHSMYQIKDINDTYVRCVLKYTDNNAAPEFITNDYELLNKLCKPKII